MNEYNVLGQLYDRLNGDVDYPAMAREIHALIGAHMPGAELVLDLGCGSGRLMRELLPFGYDMIGLDSSPAMLQQAAEQTEECRGRALLICQDMLQMELYGTVDVVLATLDVVNHVLDPSDLSRLFSLVQQYLNPGGIFIFDVNSEYKLKEVLGNHIFTSDENDIYYIWENNRDAASDVTEFYFTFFVRERGGLYRRHEESFAERAYSEETLRGLLLQSGLRVEGVFADYARRAPEPKTQRLVFVGKKVDK